MQIVKHACHHPQKRSMKNQSDKSQDWQTNIIDYRVTIYFMLKMIKNFKQK